MHLRVLNKFMFVCLEIKNKLFDYNFVCKLLNIKSVDFREIFISYKNSVPYVVRWAFVKIILWVFYLNLFKVFYMCVITF